MGKIAFNLNVYTIFKKWKKINELRMWFKRLEKEQWDKSPEKWMTKIIILVCIDLKQKTKTY